MKLLDNIKQRKADRLFEERYEELNTKEREILQLLIINDRTATQLRNRGYSNPHTVIDHLNDKGFEIETIAYSNSYEQEYHYIGVK